MDAVLYWRDMHTDKPGYCQKKWSESISVMEKGRKIKNR